MSSIELEAPAIRRMAMTLVVGMDTGDIETIAHFERTPLATIHVGSGDGARGTVRYSARHGA